MVGRALLCEVCRRRLAQSMRGAPLRQLTPERIRRWHLIQDVGTSNEWWLEWDWSRRFDNPITMPDGSVIRTVGEVGRVCH